MKNKLFNKIVKKDYNDRLEEVLARKTISEEVKNTLLSIFYKIENGYDDYNTVKKDTFDKKIYIEKLIKIIDKDCKSIEFINLKDNEEEIVDKKNKKIMCYPIDTKILYSIAKIQKRNVIVKYLDESIEQSISEWLNNGNNINMVEPLRDFNGFSWNIITQDIGDLNCNLMYQNIIFLVGNEFIDKWVNNYEPLVDYFDLFQSKLEEKYGKKIKSKIIYYLLTISVMMKTQKDDNFRKNLENKIDELKEKLNKYENREKYLTEISDLKKQKEKELKKLDKIINNKNDLLKEYENRNKNLPLERKIFSIRVLKNILKEEREKLLEQLKEYNNEMNPKKFLESKNNIIQKLKYLDIFQIDEEEEVSQKIINNLIKLQKQIIKCMAIKLVEAKEKEQLVNIIYQYRYYSYLPIYDNINIEKVKELKRNLNELIEDIITKAIQEKILIQISDNIIENNIIMKKIILSKIISLEDIEVQITKKNNEFYLTIFDEEIEDENFKLKNINQENIKIKLNKKIKLFKI